MARISRRAFLASVAANALAMPLSTARAGERLGPTPQGVSPAATGRPVDETVIATAGVTANADPDLANIASLPVRVRLSLGGGVTHEIARVSADGPFDVVNAQDGGRPFPNAPAGEWFEVYTVNVGGATLFRVRRMRDGADPGAYTGPILIQPLDHDQRVRARSATTGVERAFRGCLRIRKPNPAASGLWVVNVLEPSWLADPMEKYLYGVVPVEMPDSWHAEALKAQAVAARSFAATYYQTLDDGTYVHITDVSQAYLGYGRESASGRTAVDATRGVVATYAGAVVQAYYSSACGGHTEHNEHVFGGSPVPYLRGVRCNDDGSYGDLSDGNLAAQFWQGRPASFCDQSSKYRWVKTWSREALEAFVNANLASASPTPPYTAGTLGQLAEVRAMERGVSGKIRRLRIINRAGATWDVSGDVNVRKILRDPANGGYLDTGNVIFQHTPAPGDGLTSVTAYGGGYGHSLGLCQYGAKGMAEKGYRYDQILRHYFSGSTVQGGGQIPSAPQPTSGNFYLPTSPITLRWTGTAATYQAQVFDAQMNLIRDSGWMGSASFPIGTLALGRYKWYVRGQNAAGIGPFCALQGLNVVSQIRRVGLPLVLR